MEAVGRAAREDLWKRMEHKGQETWDGLEAWDGGQLWKWPLLLLFSLFPVGPDALA